MLLHCQFESLPRPVARREISADHMSLMVSRAGLSGINCICSDSSLSAGSAFTPVQAPTLQGKNSPALSALLGEGRGAGNLLSPWQCNPGERTSLLRAVTSPALTLLQCHSMFIAIACQVKVYKAWCQSLLSSVFSYLPCVNTYSAFSQCTSMSKDQSPSTLAVCLPVSWGIWIFWCLSPVEYHTNNCFAWHPCSYPQQRGQDQIGVIVLLFVSG